LAVAYRHRSSGVGSDAPARRGWAILIDRGRDHIDGRLNLYYSIDLIFRASFLVTTRQCFSQRPPLGEQLIPRFSNVRTWSWVMVISPQGCRPFASNAAPRSEKRTES
jgi:hypothetical protein